MAIRFLTIADANTLNGKPIPARLHRVEILDARGVISSGISVISREDAIKQAKRFAVLPFDDPELVVFTDLGEIHREEALS